MPSSNVVRFISRALAGEWPYDPDQIEYRRHPSLSQRLVPVSRFFVMPEWDERSIQTGIEVVRRHARLVLADQEVRHFEIVPIDLTDYYPVEHTECDAEGCEDCNGLGHLFIETEGAQAYLMGWLAITYVG